MAIITVEEYKALTGITDTKQDTQIAALIPVIEEDFLLIRNKPLDEEGVFPSGSKMVAAEMISFKLQSLEGNVGTSSESTSKYSHSFDFRKFFGYPQYIVQKIKRYTKVIL